MSGHDAYCPEFLVGGVIGKDAQVHGSSQVAPSNQMHRLVSGAGYGGRMPRPRKLDGPFRYFNSSPEVIRLVVMMYVGSVEPNAPASKRGRVGAPHAPPTQAR